MYTALNVLCIPVLHSDEFGYKLLPSQYGIQKLQMRCESIMVDILMFAF